MPANGARWEAFRQFEQRQSQKMTTNRLSSLLKLDISVMEAEFEITLHLKCRVLYVHLRLLPLKQYSGNWSLGMVFKRSYIDTWTAHFVMDHVI